MAWLAESQPCLFGRMEAKQDRLAFCVLTENDLERSDQENLVERVAEFLREIDGKTTASGPGKDYEGEPVSEAEVRFKLGDRREWEAERAKLEAERSARPFVLRLDQDEVEHLSTQPAYVTYELLHCARRTVLARTAVFRGLKRGGDAPPKVENGCAFFGKPRQAHHNDGTPFPAPPGMVFVVYADEDGYLFDWDWVQEDPDKPGYPLGPLTDRFDREESDLKQDVVLDLPKDLRPGHFDARKACYSSRGDCIFCYMTDEESYAVRINTDLTVFQQFGTNEHTGFKIKNVRRILQVNKSIVVVTHQP
ncbi:MAG: hypothetical protein HY000_25800 [Planctomycetes bacterium]|nr:hypothetical protein [Planctomycetota bacterium]